MRNQKEIKHDHVGRLGRRKRRSTRILIGLITSITMKEADRIKKRVEQIEKKAELIKKKEARMKEKI